MSKEAPLTEIRDHLADIAQAARDLSARIEGRMTEAESDLQPSLAQLIHFGAEAFDLGERDKQGVGDGAQLLDELSDRLGLRGMPSSGGGAGSPRELFALLLQRGNLRLDFSLGHESSNSSTVGTSKVGRGGGADATATPDQGAQA